MSAGAAVLFGTVEAIDEHRTAAWHPERHARLAAVTAGVERAGLGDGIAALEGRPARFDELARVHDPQYLEALRGLVDAGGGDLDPDTQVSPGSWTTACAAAGLGLAAVEALREGSTSATAAFVAPRPPGHHATRTRGMGFCLLNNVAVTAAALADEGQRVLIVDWDVHHGNGTQDLFWDDPRVVYVSTHESPAYPGTGSAFETGGPLAPGATVNIPLPAGATGDVALAAVDDVVAPVVDRFRPDWVLVSAGFDAHRDDPLAGLAWSSGDYADLTRRIAAFAPAPGRVVAFLEGGYDLDALARSVSATVGALAGQDVRPETATNGGPGRLEVAVAQRAQRRVVELGGGLP